MTRAITSSWKSKFVAGLGIALVMLIAACSKQTDDPFVESSRCFYAGTALNEPFLVAASKFWVDKHLADVKLNNRDLVVGAEKLQTEIAPDGTRTSARTILDVADKWKRSDYCQKVVEEFKQEVPKIIAKVAEPQTDNKCESLRSQLAVMGDAVLGSPKSQVMPGVIGTVNNALANFSQDKQEYLKSEMAKAPEDFVGLVARSCSSENKGELTAAVNQTKIASGYVSQRTSMLRLPEKRQDEDCGDISEVYCRADLVRQISYPLFVKSVQCDKEVKLTGDCDWSAESVVSTQLQQAETRVLTKAKAGLERYIADPESADVGFRNRVNELANRCRADAMSRGIRGNALYDYANGTCMQAARQQLVAVRERALGKVNARLEQLSASEPTQPASAAASAR